MATWREKMLTAFIETKQRKRKVQHKREKAWAENELKREQERQQRVA